jgi:hypothetical protein
MTGAWICHAPIDGDACHTINPGQSIDRPYGAGVETCEGCGAERETGLVDDCLSLMDMCAAHLAKFPPRATR